MPEKMKCPNCGAPLVLVRNGREAKCEYCDSEFKIDTGEEDIRPGPPSDVYEYGNKSAGKTASKIVPSRKSRTTCLILCILLGWVGAHQFYVGKYGWGIAYLCSVGLFYIGWFSDIVKIIKGEFTDSEGHPVCLDYDYPTL